MSSANKKDPGSSACLFPSPVAVVPEFVFPAGNDDDDDEDEDEDDEDERDGPRLSMRKEKMPYSGTFSRGMLRRLERS